MDQLWARRHTAEELAASVVSVLRMMAPSALCACQLTGEPRPALAWNAASAPPSPKLEDWLRKGFAGLDPTAPGPLRAPFLDERLQSSCRAAAITEAGTAEGFLLIAFRPTVSASLELTTMLLVDAAKMLALRLRLEAEERRCSQLKDRLGAREDLAEAASYIAHEFNNCLNGILLQTSILHVRASPQFEEEVGVIRAQGRQAAALLRPLQQNLRDHSDRLGRVSLNAAVSEAAAYGDGAGRSPRLDLAPDLPPVMATAEGLRRLVGWLLRVAWSRQPRAAGELTVRTWSEKRGVMLSVSDGGPPIPEPVMDSLFNPKEGLFEQSTALQGWATRSRLRQFGARLHAESRPEGGMTFTVEWSGEPRPDGGAPES
jgi:signal transduction histidine kinase